MSKSKKGRGRPLASPEPRDQYVSVRLNTSEFKCLESFAWRYDQSYSEVVRQSLMILSVIPES